jgi:hypothetical protein
MVPTSCCRRLIRQGQYTTLSCDMKRYCVAGGAEATQRRSPGCSRSASRADRVPYYATRECSFITLLTCVLYDPWGHVLRDRSRIRGLIRHYCATPVRGGVGEKLRGIMLGQIGDTQIGGEGGDTVQQMFFRLFRLRHERLQEFHRVGLPRGTQRLQATVSMGRQGGTCYSYHADVRAQVHTFVEYATTDRSHPGKNRLSN